MRISIYLILLLLGGCANNERNYEQESNSRDASECIEREAALLAKTSMDLENAAITVVAKCDAYTGALRRKLYAQYPGYRDYVASKLREVDEIYLAQARLAVARSRQSR